jgi:hypothetical protein
MDNFVESPNGQFCQNGQICSGQYFAKLDNFVVAQKRISKYEKHFDSTNTKSIFLTVQKTSKNILTFQQSIAIQNQNIMVFCLLPRTEQTGPRENCRARMENSHVTLPEK